jgi:large subunit ribosomal protein L5
MTARLQQHYHETLVPLLKKKLGIQNNLAVPKLEKIVLNMSVSRALQDGKLLEIAQSDLTRIAGQKAVLTKAKSSIAAFKLREGMNIGAKVTLRKKRMYEFLERLVTMALPRVRNYQGASAKSFDGHGNYALGIPEHIVFYEVDYNSSPITLGLDIVLVTSATNDNDAYPLIRGLGIPLKERKVDHG